MAGVRCACVANAGIAVTVAPTKLAWAAANRFIVADSGPGIHTRDDESMLARRVTSGKDRTQEAAVRTTDLGRVVVPDVRSAMRTPCACASSTAATGSAVDPTSQIASGIRSTSRARTAAGGISE
jgi:hypothetical protein